MNPYKEILRKFFSEYVSALRKRSVCVAVDQVWETEREALRSITKYPLKREPLPSEFIAILAAYIKNGDAA